MFIVKAGLACARYAIGFVLLLGAATVLNIGIVLGWNYFSPESFSRSVAIAVNSIDAKPADAGPVDASGGGPVLQVSSQGQL